MNKGRHSKLGAKKQIIIAFAALLGLLAAVFLLILVTSTLRHNNPSKIWYVSTTGQGQFDGTSQATPFATIQQAVDVAMPGDTIKLADGSYLQSFTSARDGKKGHPITIEGSRNAVIYGTKSRIIEINHSYLQLKGFSVNGLTGDGNVRENYKDKLIFIISLTKGKGVKNVVLDDLSLENAGGECVHLKYLAHDNEIANSTIKNCGVYDFKFDGDGKNGEGVYIGTAPEQLSDGRNPTNEVDTSHNNWIHHNDIETNGNECVDIKEGAVKNIIENNICTGQLDPESGGMDARGNENIFRYNTIFGNVGAGVRLGGDEEEDGINNQIYGNTITDNRGPGIKIVREPQGKICDNITSDNKYDADEGIEPEQPCE